GGKSSCSTRTGRFTAASPSRTSETPCLPPRTHRRAARSTPAARRGPASTSSGRGEPTTAEVNAHWRAEGRRGVANAEITRLIRAGSIRRVSDPAVRDSRYIAVPGDGGPDDVGTAVIAVRHLRTDLRSAHPTGALQVPVT